MTNNEKKLQMILVQQTREWNRSNMLGWSSCMLEIEELAAKVVEDNVKAVAAAAELAANV